MIIYAHRGLLKNSKYSENTISAIKQVIRKGCNNIEVDIQLSADNIPILWHDEIQSSEAPTLAELLRTFPETTFNLELKTYPKHTTSYKYLLVHRVIIETINHKNIVFSSFDIKVCKILKAFLPENAQIMLITETNLAKTARLAKKNKLYGVVFDANKLNLDKKMSESGLVWWSYNKIDPFVSAAIIDITLKI